MGPATYEVHHPEKKKPKQTYHVNMLKACEDQSSEDPVSNNTKVLMVRQVNLEVEMEAEPKELTEAGTPVLNHLPPVHAKQLQKVLNEAPSLFRASLGKTDLVEHVVRLKEQQPIRQLPYCVPQQLVEKLQQEVEEMLRLGVIEPYNSEWCSPMVIIFKKPTPCVYVLTLENSILSRSLTLTLCPELMTCWRRLELPNTSPLLTCAKDTGKYH